MRPEPPIAEVLLDDDPARVGDDDRYGIYALRDGQPVEVCQTSREGIGVALVALDEDRRDADDPLVPVLAVLDRRERRWITSLWHPKGATR